MGENNKIDPEYAEILRSQEEAEKAANEGREAAGLPPLEEHEEVDEVARKQREANAQAARARDIEVREAARKMTRAWLKRGEMVDPRGPKNLGTRPKKR